MKRFLPSALCLFATLATESRVFADARAYDGVKDLKASAGNTTAEHHHDWKAHTAYVRVLDASGKTLAERPSPALNTLFVTPDGRYVVGLSSIKASNPSQIFILGRDGAYVHEEGVSCSDPRLKGRPCLESVSNAIEWFDWSNPGIELVVEAGRPTALEVNEHRDSSCGSPKPSLVTPAEWHRRCPDPPRRLRLPLKP